jgi:hypothetical protein
MITENDPMLPRKVDLEKNPSGTELKIARQREMEKYGKYVAVPGDKTRTRIFVRNGENVEKKIAAYLERINNRPQRWN